MESGLSSGTTGLLAEQAQVKKIVDTALAELPDGIAQFAQSAVDQDAGLRLSGVVLAAGTPAADSAEATDRRVALAAALELLQIALNIHRLLLLAPKQTDTIDKSLLGGTILVGDFCFSRAAVLAARTQNPAVVTIFADLLKQLSEANLRRLIQTEPTEHDAQADERSMILYNGALAGAVLAGLTPEEQTSIATYAQELAHGSPAADQLPAHQRSRWQEIAASRA